MQRREILTLCQPTLAVPGIGPVRSRQLREAGLETVGDLLLHLPFRYEDRRRVWRLDELQEPGLYTLIGRISSLQTLRIRKRRLTVVRGRFTAAGQEIPVVWFNRPYAGSQIDGSRDLLVHGAVRERGGGWELVNPTVESLGSATLAATIVPVYPSAGGLGPALLRRTMSAMLARLDWDSVEEPLPHGLLRRHGLPPLAEALARLHDPPPDSDVEALNERTTPWHCRLVYGEVLRAQLALAEARRRGREHAKPHTYADPWAAIRSLVAALPFALTGAQERSLREIVSDLASPYPMARLLQGDVGCGKTVVAALALAAAAKSGLQGALMVPTELLAEQHMRALSHLLGDVARVALMTSSSLDLARQREALASGAIPLVVGTHALIQESVAFHRLGLVIVDEQHRFGVAHRRSLQLKGELPDLLVMTATPIPRSLTLAVYGDLSISVIDELPPGRGSVATRVVPQSERESVYDALEKELARGARAYVVLPLIEESAGIEAESIAGLGRRIERRLAAYRPVVIHGRSDAAERDRAMRAFSSGRSRVLIATTLIEVGVDVAEATQMVIESAERFGLSQLHQLRGRVGRGRREAQCVALHGKLTDQAGERLSIFSTTQDGFELAEADLELRGPGDVLGTRQSGAAGLRIANLVRDRDWLEKARHDARDLVAGSALEAQRLARRLGISSAGDPLAGG